MKKIKTLLMLLILSLFLVPIHASEDDYVTDTYGLLSTSEIESLNQSAEEISNQYGIGVYVRVVDGTEGYSIEDYSEHLYETQQLGLGTEDNRQCVMFLVDMDSRHYDLMAHGSIGNAAFTDYGKDELIDRILPFLKSGDYETCFQTFIEECDRYLYQQANGTPIDVPGSEPEDPAVVAARNKNIRMGVTFIGGPVISLIVCLILKAKNKTKGIKVEAGNYIPDNGVNITGMQDIYLYRTETVTHVHHDDHGGGGTSVNSGGFSHSSGSF